MRSHVYMMFLRSRSLYLTTRSCCHNRQCDMIYRKFFIVRFATLIVVSINDVHYIGKYVIIIETNRVTLLCPKIVLQYTYS